MKKLIVFSADAMVWEDVAYLKTLPNFQKYLAGGCVVEQVESVYPTITYPCHTTIASGVYPDKHGISGNFHLAPGVRPALWMWEHSNKKMKEDIFQAAKLAGYTTAAVFWPMTGGHPYVDYLIDEFWPQTPEEDKDYLEYYRQLGSNDQMLEIIEKNMDLEGIKGHPFRDHFSVLCASDVIRRCRPDVLFLHPANIDSARHSTGVFGSRVRTAIEETDQWLGQLMQAVEEIGELENTNLVMVSDHGQMESKRVINPNVLLADHGLIRVNDDGTLKDWDAWCQCGGMSAVVYLKDPSDQEIYDRVYRLLRDLAEEGIYGFTQVFTTKETAEKYHLDGPFSFVLESDGYTGFAEGYRRPLVTNFDASDYRMGKATHGYLPFKGPQPVFLAKGPDFREGVVIPKGRLIDEAPTYAKLLGVELPWADGKPMEELLR